MKVTNTTKIELLHELNTPVSTLKGLFDLILEDLDEEIIKSNNFKGVLESLSQIEYLLNDFDDYGNINFKSEFKVSELIHEIHKSLLIVFPDLAPLKINTSANEPVIKEDKYLLIQIFQNLFSNAAKYAKSKKIEVNIETTSNKNNINYALTVFDHGIGLSEENLKLVFQEGWRKPNQKAKGKGLGLHIAKKKIQLLNGDIKATNTLDKGLAFEINFSSQKAVEIQQNDISNLKENKILLIEDNKLNYLLMKGILKNSDYDLTWVKSSKDALRSIKENKFDLIIVDYNLEDDNGKDVINRLKENLNNLPPLIVTSANSNPLEKENDSKNGFIRFIKKPIEKIAFLEFLNDLSNSKYLNLNYLNSISGGDRAFETEVLLTALELIPKDFEEFNLAIIQNNIDKIKATAHKLESSLSVVGMKFEDMCLVPFNNITEADLLTVSNNVEKLKVQIELTLIRYKNENTNSGG